MGIERADLVPLRLLLCLGDGSRHVLLRSGARAETLPRSIRGCRERGDRRFWRSTVRLNATDLSTQKRVISFVGGCDEREELWAFRGRMIELQVF